MNGLQRQYLKTLKKICGKCKAVNDSKEHIIHCCYPGVYLPKFLTDLLNKKNKLQNHPIRRVELNLRGEEEAFMIPHCLAYNKSENKCFIQNYKPQVCRSYYCKKWNDVDKKIIIKGCFKEISEEKLLNHIKYIYPKLKINYLIISNNPSALVKKISKINGLDKIFLDNNASIKQINPLKEVFREHQVIVTNTQLDDFLNDEEDWDDIKYNVIEKYLFITNNEQ